MRRYVLMATALALTLEAHAEDPFEIQSTPSFSFSSSSDSSISYSSASGSGSYSPSGFNSYSSSGSSSSSYSSSDFACHHKRNRTVNTLGPLLRLSMTPSTFCENFALSILGEGGERMYRGSATLGFNLCDMHWFKGTAEILGQKLLYDFSCGHEKKWIGQFATGGTYLCKFNCSCVDSFAFSGYYSHAQSAKLSTAFCAEPAPLPRQMVSADPDAIPDLSSSLEPIVLRRRIAGSNSGSGSAGITFIPWTCGRLTFSGIYDYVAYNRELTYEKHIHGFGGGITFHQRLAEFLDVTLTGEFRRPFDYFSFDFNWRRNLWDGWIDLGGFVTYTYGKSQLNYVTTAGFQFNWFFGCPDCGTSETACETGCFDTLCNPKEFSTWVSKPAVYMPTVLAIPEQCKGTAVSHQLANVFIPFGSSANIDTSVGFSDPPRTRLFFSATGLPAGFSINSRTGVITGTNTVSEGLVTIITVSAINGCAKASQQFVLTLGGSA